MIILAMRITKRRGPREIQIDPVQRVAHPFLGRDALAN